VHHPCYVDDVALIAGISHINYQSSSPSKEIVMSSIKDMVEYIAKSLADRPDEVQVSESMGESVIMVELNVASEDMGRMIGRKGRTINAIRSVARVLGGKMNKKVSIEIV
jgi:hypothetical protein